MIFPHFRKNESWAILKKTRILHQIKPSVMDTPTMTRLIADYFKTQPVLKAWLFGSFARGEERPDSDVDILVALDYSQPLGFKYFGMWGELERKLNRKVDLVTEGSLYPYAEETANHDKKLIYERAD